jgi:hypothetical protein
MIQGIPIQFCTQIIERYIFEKKGELVSIIVPISLEHEEKFITALNIACSYYGITL